MFVGAEIFNCGSFYFGGGRRDLRVLEWSRGEERRGGKSGGLL
jgi:hypothetical protein